MKKYLFPIVFILAFVLSSCQPTSLNNDDRINLYMQIGHREFIAEHCPGFQSWADLADTISFNYELRDSYLNPFKVKGMVYSNVLVDGNAVSFDEDVTSVKSGGYEVQGAERRQVIAKAIKFLGGISRYKITFKVTPTLENGEVTFSLGNFVCTPLHSN